MDRTTDWLRWIGTLVLVVIPLNASTQPSVGQKEPKGPGEVPAQAQAQPSPLTVQDMPANRASVPSAPDAVRLSSEFGDVVQNVLPSVVMLQVELQLSAEDIPRELRPYLGVTGHGHSAQTPVVHGGASGIIVRQDGVILTNAHVVENSRRIETRLFDGRTYRAKVLGIDAPSDLALIRIDANGLPAARLADSDRSRVGEWVLAIGAPLGLDATVTQGVLSGKGREGLGASEIEDYLQTDAKINPGSSGGPLVNLRGEVLGINTIIVGRSTGIGMAIPSRMARSVIDQILKTGHVVHPWIGASVQDLTNRLSEALGSAGTHGALVNAIEPGAPAARAGIQIGDIVTHINEQNISSRHDLMANLEQRRVGEHVALTVVRNGTVRTISLQTGNYPMARGGGPASTDPSTEPNPAAGRLGLRLATVPPEIAARDGIPGGAIVLEVEPGSAGDMAGLRRGDVILHADGHRVRSPEDVRSSVTDRHAALLVRRGDAQAFLPVFLE